VRITSTMERAELIFGDSAVSAAQRRPFLSYLARLGPGSRETMAGCLATICRDDPSAFAWERLRREHTLVIRGWLVERYAPATAAKHLAALRGVLREAWRSGLLDGDAFARATDLPAVRGGSARKGRHVTPAEIRAVLDYCAHDGVRGARNAAVVALLYGAGLRVHEAVAACDDHLSVDLRSVTVRGKGARLRTAYFVGGADALLRRWLEARGADLPSSPILREVRRGVVGASTLTTQALAETCARLARKAVIEPFTPHDLRRTHATKLLHAGVDVLIVQRQLGHANVRTTSIYDYRPDLAQADAIAGVSL